MTRRRRTREQQDRVNEQRRAYISAHPEKVEEYRLRTYCNYIIARGYRVVAPDGREVVRK